ncbi:Bacteriochlorophyll synthase 44.5 kDa chain [Beijerinckiaceae bacterium RH AL1]|nr:Bacteriochlorophyll synthase 44.5 kDa chain [Beijerinckiaceae bacterium RH AL8]VVB43669.1 Bacteriochlorophyll synthase 44.5 kDa chain [Beijerinckiaceae bacterium RH CH11]VVC53944.1 Bacteriochlorophyll synthase 44.5 kDa chain [Beijerinckiaceae bacterium RH AL1]
MAAPERSAAPLSWLGIVRLGLVQTALGAIFVLATTTLNRVMVIELALPAVLPGALIAFHYAMQVLRPRLGHGSDVGGRRTPWILGGMAVLAAGGFSAACATALMRTHLALGIALAVPAFVAIGLGVGAAGTALLVLIAKRTAPERRPAAATIAWVMMIVGFIVTAGVAGKLLAPFSPQRLIETSAAISGIGFLVTCLAVLGVEGRAAPSASDAPRESFAAALRQVWSEPLARRFAIFVFVSMLAYGGEDLLIEPFAGALFGLGAGETAKLTGLLHAGALAGMIAVPLSAGLLPRWRGVLLRGWMTGGCVASAAALVGLGALGVADAPHLLRPALAALGFANGGYAIAAIAAMMQLVGTTGAGPGKESARHDGARNEGTKMGLWGAAQACAFGAGGLAATMLSDFARALAGTTATAYAIVFALEAAIFLASALLAMRLEGVRRTPSAAFTASARPT